MSSSKCNFRRRGFTLLELTVALAMVAVLAVSLYASMKIAFRAKAAAELAVEPTRTAELAMDFIRNDLQNTLPPTGVLAQPFQGTNTGGTTGSDGDVTLFSTASAKNHPSANGEIKEIELTTDTPAGATQRCLVRKCLRNLTAQQPPDPDEEILVRGISAFNLRYFDGTTWNNQWDSTQENNELPAAVEVSLTLDRSTSPQDPKLIKYVRVFQLPCSNAAFDSQVNSGAAQ